MTTRPVDITTSTSETATDISFVFNYPIINSQEIQVRTVQDTSSNTNIGLNGLQIKYNDNKNTNVVLFNNNSYSFNSFYISKGADITTGTEYDYSVIIKNKNSKPNKNDNLYILIPFDSNDNNLSDTPNDFSTLKSTINTYSTDISTNNNNYINIGNLNLNLNEIINTDDTFYTYTLDNDTFISLPSSIVSLNMSDPSFEQFYSEITDASVSANATTATINTSSNFPMNMDLNIYGSEENIYIDCSPVADGSQEQIIREKKVYSIKPLINVKSLGDAGNALLFTFILVIVCIFCFLIYRNVDTISSGMKTAATLGSAAGSAAGNAAGSAATSAKSLGMPPLKFTIITIRTIVEPLIKSIFLRKFKIPIQDIQNIDENINITEILELDELKFDYINYKNWKFDYINYDNTKNSFPPPKTLGIIGLLLVVGLFLMVIINVYTDLINMNSKEKKPKIISAKMISYGWILIALYIGFCATWFFLIPLIIPSIMKNIVGSLQYLGKSISEIDITNKLKNIAKSVCLSIICALLFIPGFYVFGKVSTITFVSYLLFIILLSAGNFILFRGAAYISFPIWLIFIALGAAVIFGGLVK